MRAAIGPDDVEFFQEPVPNLLVAMTGIRPEPAGLHVLLNSHGMVSTQRLALSGFSGGLVAGLWPGELKAQAEYLYGGRRGCRMIRAARACGWIAEGAPQLAFRNSAPSQRLYMQPSIDAHAYASRWENGDLAQVGAHSRADVEQRLWPWLRDRGYADAEDDPTLRLGWTSGSGTDSHSCDLDFV